MLNSEIYKNLSTSEMHSFKTVSNLAVRHLFYDIRTDSSVGSKHENGIGETVSISPRSC